MILYLRNLFIPKLRCETGFGFSECPQENPKPVSQR